MDIKIIQAKLEQRKQMMRLAFISFVVLIYVGAVGLQLQCYIPEFVAVIIAMVMAALRTWLSFVRCPRCARSFAHKTRQPYPEVGYGLFVVSAIAVVYWQIKLATL